ncbi:MAG: hypothetical protein VSS75_006875 [Candidatus Parabeggiatoa sp.]|nr:hypothetical protein [Candidatus Parabeggiatoa sp.]
MPRVSNRVRVYNRVETPPFPKVRLNTLAPISLSKVLRRRDCFHCRFALPRVSNRARVSNRVSNHVETPPFPKVRLNTF